MSSAAGALLATLIAAAQPPAFLVAVDEGTRLQPIARVSGEEWSSPAGLALPRAWTRWYTTGTSAAVEVRSTRAACAAVAAPSPRPAGLLDAGHVGIATAGGAVVAAARRLAPGSPELAVVEPAVRRAYEQREREQRLSASNVSGFPMRVDRVYATPAGTTPAVYYFEASKRIPDAGGSTDPDDPKGTLRITVAGWLRASDRGMVPLGTRSELRWEQDDRPSPATGGDMVPLGLVRHAGRYAWVMKSPGVRRNAFAVYDTPQGGVRMLASADAGVCGA